MNHNININKEDDIRSEYDFAGGIRGKHFQAYRQSTNLVSLYPDVAEMFPDAAAVSFEELEIGVYSCLVCLKVGLYPIMSLVTRMVCR